MKKLEELGISPTPWKVCDERTLSGEIVGVECADRRKDLVAGDFVITEPNAKLIAASPKLYAACYEMRRYYYEPNTNTTVFKNALALMKQAVCEASGEGEV